MNITPVNTKDDELHEVMKHLEMAEDLLNHSLKIHPMVIKRNLRRIKRILKELESEINHSSEVT